MDGLYTSPVPQYFLSSLLKISFHDDLPLNCTFQLFLTTGVILSRITTSSSGLSPFLLKQITASLRWFRSIHSKPSDENCFSYKAGSVLYKLARSRTQSFMPLCESYCSNSHGNSLL